MARLEKKKILVTAAAQGIGRASAEAFAAEGADVWATDIDVGKLEALKSRSGVTIRQLDVTDGGAVRSLAAELDALDVLFNCAGTVHHGTILDCEEKDWDISFDPQRQVHVPDDTGILAGYDRRRRGFDHQYVFRRIQHKRSAKPVSSMVPLRRPS